MLSFLLLSLSFFFPPSKKSYVVTNLIKNYFLSKCPYPLLMLMLKGYWGWSNVHSGGIDMSLLDFLTWLGYR